MTGATLTRLFGVHVAILPMIATTILLVHLALVQVHGMSIPPGIEKNLKGDGGAKLRAMPFVPHFLLREMFGWTVALALLAGLAAFYPWELGAKADPFKPAPAGIQPEWYFLWMFQVLKLVPPTVAGINGELIAVLALAVAGLAVFFLPFLSTTAQRQRIVRSVGWAALLFMAIMTAMAVLTRGSAAQP